MVVGSRRAGGGLRKKVWDFNTFNRHVTYVRKFCPSVHAVGMLLLMVHSVTTHLLNSYTYLDMEWKRLCGVVVDVLDTYRFW